jgi:hypothetical protein
MILFKNFQVWDREESAFFLYPPGSARSFLGVAIIHCVKSGEAQDITPEQVFSRIKTERVSVFRGFLILSVFQAVGDLMSNEKASELATGVFFRDRTLLYHYQDMAESKADVEFQRIRHGKIGDQVYDYLDWFRFRLGLSSKDWI